MSYPFEQADKLWHEIERIPNPRPKELDIARDNMVSAESQLDYHIWKFEAAISDARRVLERFTQTFTS